MALVNNPDPAHRDIATWSGGKLTVKSAKKRLRQTTRDSGKEKAACKL